MVGNSDSVPQSGATGVGANGTSIINDNSQLTQMLNMSTVAIQSKLLPFWREHPQLWFIQFESMIDPQCSDEQKFRYVLQQLQPTDIRHLSDLLLRPPESEKYSAIKERLLSVYGTSEVENFRKLIRGLELGDQKPSALLRKMRELGGSFITDDGLRIEWLNHLPPLMRSTLVINTEAKLDTLAAMADKMFEYDGGHTRITSISPTHPTPSTSATDPMLLMNTLSRLCEKLTLTISELRTEVAELKQSNRVNRRRYRSSSRSRTRSNSRKPGDKDWECRFHYKFGDRARRCESPCVYKSGNESRSQQ